MSNIEWTDTTWNPVVGCTPVSPGCLNCYAATMAHRLEAMGRPEYVGLTVKRKGSTRAAGPEDATVATALGKVSRDVFNGTVRCLPDRLTAPLSWKKPRMVFVNSMSDLFHEAVPFEFIDRVFAVMALCPRHTFQVLTKRPERMAEYFAERSWGDVISDVRCDDDEVGRRLAGLVNFDAVMGGTREGVLGYHTPAPNRRPLVRDCWPLPNVWLGTSVEDQARADERIPHLLRCPAAVRFLSCEPLLGEVDLLRVDAAGFGGPRGHKIDCIRKGYWSDGPFGFVNHSDMHDRFGPLHWVIVGGESGPNARPCDVGWIRSIVTQCQGAGVPVFVKQLGACFHDAPNGIAGAGLDIAPEGMALLSYRLRDRKGGDPAEWPEDLRVREWPRVAGSNESRVTSNEKGQVR